MKDWTEKHIRGLLHDQKIRDYRITEKHKNYSQNKPVVIPRGKPKGLIWLEWNLTYWGNERALSLRREYYFAEPRKFRFDFCFPAIMVAIEYNGIMADKSRHTTVTGYSMDMEKMNLAQSLGWTILAYTPLNYTTALKDLNNLYQAK